MVYDIDEILKDNSNDSYQALPDELMIPPTPVLTIAEKANLEKKAYRGLAQFAGNFDQVHEIVNKDSCYTLAFQNKPSSKYLFTIDNHKFKDFHKGDESKIMEPFLFEMAKTQAYKNSKAHSKVDLFSWFKTKFQDEYKILAPNNKSFEICEAIAGYLNQYTSMIKFNYNCDEVHTQFSKMEMIAKGKIQTYENLIESETIDEPKHFQTFHNSKFPYKRAITTLKKHGLHDSTILFERDFDPKDIKDYSIIKDKLDEFEYHFENIKLHLNQVIDKNINSNNKVQNFIHEAGHKDYTRHFNFDNLGIAIKFNPNGRRSLQSALNIAMTANGIDDLLQIEAQLFRQVFIGAKKHDRLKIKGIETEIKPPVNYEQVQKVDKNIIDYCCFNLARDNLLKGKERLRKEDIGIIENTVVKIIKAIENPIIHRYCYQPFADVLGEDKIKLEVHNGK